MAGAAWKTKSVLVSSLDVVCRQLPPELVLRLEHPARLARDLAPGSGHGLRGLADAVAAMLLGA